MDSLSVNPRTCHYCNECGGCDYIDIPYSQTLKIKLNDVKELLNGNKVRPENIKDINIIPSPKIFNYRNRCQLHVKQGVTGFFKKRSHELIKINKCLMLDERINKKISELRFPNTYDAKIELYLSGNSVSERLVEKKYENSFGQINDGINSIITQKIIDLMDVKKDDHLLELYCGQGNFTFAILDKVPSINITGIDVKTPKIQRKGVEFIQADAEKGLKRLSSTGKVSSYNKILLDPPRAGAGQKVSSMMSTIKAEKIIYVSCNPGTLAEDANIICANGYSWGHMELFDMFPFTKYVESISAFVRE